MFFFSSRRRHTRCALVTGVQRVLFRSLASDTLKIARHQKGPNMQTSTYKPRIPEMNLYVPTPGTLIRNHIRQGSAVVGLPRNDGHIHCYYEGGVSSETRSEEHTSELQSLMPTSYAVFRLKQITTL